MKINKQNVTALSIWVFLIGRMSSFANNVPGVPPPSINPPGDTDPEGVFINQSLVWLCIAGIIFSCRILQKTTKVKNKQNKIKSSQNINL